MNIFPFNRTRSIPGLAAALLFLAGTAFAFPTWMGVYGAYEHHASGNPGTFSILMNQDYVGLHAEVGVQINGGTWETYDMSWAGNPDGNSLWQFTPSAPFPTGASVTYYFHGYDDWGGHIYDSDQGNNYSFTTAGGGGAGLNWGPMRPLPFSGRPQNAEMAAYNGELFAVWTEGDASGTTLYFSKNAGAANWQAAGEVASDSYPHIAVSSSGIHLVYGSGTTAHYLRSTDSGASWSAPVDFTGANYPARYALLRADDDYVYLVYNDYTPPESDNICFRRMHKNTNTWSAPVQIFTHSAYKSTVSMKDFEVRGDRMLLSSYSQSWYGGFSTPHCHESTDGGATWTEVAPDGGSIGEMDADDAGTIYHAAYDSGMNGGGVHFQKKTAGGAWSDWNNVWPGSGWITDDGLRKISAGLVLVSTHNGLRYCRTSQDDGATWSNPELIDSSNYWCVQDLKDGDSMHLLVQDQDAASNGGLYSLSTESATAPPLEWAGNAYHWPLNGDLTSADDLWINIESYPIGAGVSARVHCSSDGGATWNTNALTLNGQIGANDAWHVNLGTFPAGTDIQYAVVVVDGLNHEHWDNNGGQDFTAEVAGGTTVFQPVFWGLDPYRFDTEIVRANGRAPAAGDHGFGEFPTGQVVTITARPVENGNGNLVQQGSVTMTSILHYTLTGDYSDELAVTGTFHSAYASNKPVFDYFSYELGSFPAGTTVTCWLEAWNTAGYGFAQDSGQDYGFTVAAAGDDSDSDGLPDPWEMAYFTNLLQNATDNPDGDGPTGRPIDNIVEYALGLHPAVPNDPMGIRLLWTPSYPAEGDQVILSYFYVNEGNPLFGKPVYAHVGHNGWAGVYDTAQLQLNGQVTRFETTISVPAGATEINVVFHDNAGTWDNNGGNDWTIPIQPGGGGKTAPRMALNSPGLPGMEPVLPNAASSGGEIPPARMAASPGPLEPGLVFFSNEYALSVFNGLNGLLVGTNGLQLVGAAEGNQFGFSVSAAGDVNGDGRGDVIIGAPFYDETGSRFRAGRAYVFYGDSQFVLSEQIVILDGSNGFQLTGGATDDRKGTAVAGAGDVNGDGLDDVLVGAPFADTAGGDDAGTAYVLFGYTNSTLGFDVAALNGTNGFRIQGLAAGDHCGSAVAAAGDVNADGLDDFLVAAENAAGASGRVYVVFGRTNPPAALDLSLLDGANGFVLTGEGPDHHAGHAVAGGGDFNGDGIDDLFIGAHTAADAWQRGRGYVVFGATNWNAGFPLSALNGTNGMRLHGTNLFGQVGAAVAQADVNGDGLTDFLASAPNLNQVFALYGTTQAVPSVSVDALDGTNGFRFAVTNAPVSLGASLAAAPRVNGDRFEDFICGAPALSPGGITSAGGAYVILGRETFPAQWTSDDLDGTNGFRAEGIQALAEAGRAVGTAGDMDGDGLTELVIGEYTYDYTLPGTSTVLTNAGCIYVLSPAGIPNHILFHPWMTEITSGGGSNQLSWEGQSNVTYTIWTNSDLNSEWGIAGTLASTNGTSIWNHVTGSADTLFYRIKVTPP